MTWGRAREDVEEKGVDYPFLATRLITQKADFTVGNLEGPIAVDARILEWGDHLYRVPPFTLAGIRNAGIDLLGLANNHLMDCGKEGMAETLRYIRVAKLRAFGAGMTEAEAAEPALATIGNTRVAFVAAISPETYFDSEADAQDDAFEYDRHVRTMSRRLAAGPRHAGLIVATPSKIAALVRKADAQADLVVACLHFGIRYQRLPTQRQRALARAAVAAGADLVIGHHAHFWQPVELFSGVPILYGLGNFAFGSGNRHADEGLIARITLRDRTFRLVELFPLYTRNKDSDVDYQSKILAGDAARDMIARLADESARLGTTIRYQDGRGVLLLP